MITAGRRLEPAADLLLAAAGRREEATAAWRMLTQRDPEDLRPYFMRAFTFEALGR